MIWEGSATYRKILCFLWRWAPLSSGVWALCGVSIDTQILSSANCAAKSGQGHALSAHPSHCCEVGLKWFLTHHKQFRHPATPLHTCEYRQSTERSWTSSNFSEAHEGFLRSLNPATIPCTHRNFSDPDPDLRSRSPLISREREGQCPACLTSHGQTSTISLKLPVKTWVRLGRTSSSWNLGASYRQAGIWMNACGSLVPETTGLCQCTAASSFFKSNLGYFFFGLPETNDPISHVTWLSHVWRLPMFRSVRCSDHTPDFAFSSKLSVVTNPSQQFSKQTLEGWGDNSGWGAMCECEALTLMPRTQRQVRHSPSAILVLTARWEANRDPWKLVVYGLLKQGGKQGLVPNLFSLPQVPCVNTTPTHLHTHTNKH